MTLSTPSIKNRKVTLSQKKIIKDVNFSKIPGREASKNSKMPSFLQGTSFSRFDVGKVSEKTLKDINFDNRKFKHQRK